jgi:hypothetical protein
MTHEITIDSPIGIELPTDVLPETSTVGKQPLRCMSGGKFIEWLFDELDKPIPERFPKRRQWSESSRNTPDNEKWLVKGPMHNPEMGIVATSKTRVRNANVGVPNENEPDPEDSKRTLSNVIEHECSANRRMRKANGIVSEHKLSPWNRGLYRTRGAK